MKKYELTQETKLWCGRTLHRIRALRDFGDVKAGDLGGWVEKEENLSHGGNAWVYGNAWLCGNAEVQKTSDYTTISGFGSANRCTTFYRLKDGDIGVRCGCFCGTLAEFEAKVKETHGDSKYAREYLAAAELMRIHFEVES